MRRIAYQNGMTLVEILAGLIILSILALVFLRYMGTSLTASGNAVQLVRDSEAVVSVMERITVDYKRRLATDVNPLASLQAAIGSEGSAQNNTLGVYEVIDNAFIAFNGSGQEIPDTTVLNTLKVKIQVGDRRLVCLFTN